MNPVKQLSWSTMLSSSWPIAVVNSSLTVCRFWNPSSVAVFNSAVNSSTLTFKAYQDGGRGERKVQEGGVESECGII